MMSKQLILLILYSSILFFSCGDLNDKYFTRISENDIGLSKPKLGEWLSEHKENGQTFNEYLKFNPVKPDSNQNIIYIRPIGEFNKLQRTEIELVRDYTECFFQLKTIILQTSNDNLLPNSEKRYIGKKGEQLYAPYILDSFLLKKMPSNALIMIGITTKDLFPKPEWSYVFGLSFLKKRVGVCSLYRMQNEDISNKNFQQSLGRILKICTHEIGHCFSLKHCVYAKCLMNGANHLTEVDESTMRLCSGCQKKLHYSIKYNYVIRLNQLIEFYKKNKMEIEKNILIKDL